MTTSAFTPSSGALTLVLVDSAQIHDNKLSVLGACWNVLEHPAAHALVGLVTFAASDMDNEHEIVVRLVDSEDNPVLGHDPQGGLGPVRVSLHLNPVPRGEDALVTTLPVVVTLSGLPLAPSTTYRWVGELDASHRIEASLAFRTGANYPDLAVRLDDVPLDISLEV